MRKNTGKIIPVSAGRTGGRNTLNETGEFSKAAL